MFGFLLGEQLRAFIRHYFEKFISQLSVKDEGKVALLNQLIVINMEPPNTRRESVSDPYPIATQRESNGQQYDFSFDKRNKETPYFRPKPKRPEVQGKNLL